MLDRMSNYHLFRYVTLISELKFEIIKLNNY